MTDFFAGTYYGNTVSQWLTTFLLILGAVILGRILYWMLSRGLKAFARRSKIRLDEILIDTMEEPVVVLLILFGARTALRRLVLSDALVAVIDGALGLIYALVAAWLITRLYDAIHRHYLAPLASKTSGAFDDQMLPDSSAEACASSSGCLRSSLA